MVEGTVKEKVERNEKRRDISSCIYLSYLILSILSIYSSYLFPTLLHPILDKFPHKNGEPHQLHNSLPWPNTLNDSAAKCGAVSQADQEITHAALHPFTLKTQNIPRYKEAPHILRLCTPNSHHRGSIITVTLVFTISNGAIPGRP